MTDNEKRMIELLKNANRAMSRRFPDMKKSQREITEFLASCCISKAEFDLLYNILKNEPFECAEKAYNQFVKNINISILPDISTEYVDKTNMANADTIIKRRRENASKSVNEIFAELENAYYSVTKECISKSLQQDLSEFKSFINRKNVIDMITIGKYILNRIVTGRDRYIDTVTATRLNTLMFFIRMLEDKSCEYIKKES